MLAYLLDSLQTTRLLLWGRSMGAVTLLLYLQDHNRLDIQGHFSRSIRRFQDVRLVLDSPYMSFQEVIYQFASSKLQLNKNWEWLLKLLFDGILDGENKIHKILGFKMRRLDVGRNITSILTKVNHLLFLGSQADTLTDFERNGKAMYNKLVASPLLKHKNQVQFHKLSAF